MVLASLLVAVSLGTNYALSGVPNVKLMDLCVFLAGKHLGLLYGALVGALSWAFYGVLNPYGASLFTTVIAIVGQVSYATAGWALGNLSFSPGSASERNPAWHAAAGFFSTLLYDLFTNSAFGVFFYGSAVAGLLAMNFPLPMGVIHEASNFILFPLVAVPIEGRMNDLVGRRVAKRTLNLPRLETVLVVTASLSLLLNGFLLPNYLSLREENDRLMAMLKENTIQVNVLVNFGNGTRTWYNATVLPSGSSMYNTTTRLFGTDVAATFSPYGVMVDEIAGVGTSPDHPNSYWVWFKWDQTSGTWAMGDTAADQHGLSPGEVVAWAFVDFSNPSVVPSP